MRITLAALATLAAASVANAQPASSTPAAAYPLRIPAPGGEIILPDAGAARAHERYRFAAARRVGDMLYVSGVIVGRGQNEGNDVAAFRAQVTRALERLRVILEASGSSWREVVMINSFHVWDSPHFAGTRDEHFEAFEQAIDPYIDSPHPAWTAVGTTGLLGDRGIVEVQVIARVTPRT